jgi:hypothetical protein
MADLPIKCSVCQSLIDEEDLFCPNCGTESPGAGERKAAGPTSRLATHNFQCSGCGASMSYDASAGSLRCPFCGSTQMEAQPDTHILAPERVVPFTVEQRQAVAAMRAWLGRGFFRPSNLAGEAAVVAMRPVFVPYWVFDANTHTYWTADSSRTPPGARASWYPLAGEHRGVYRNMLIGASAVLTPDETHLLCPFDLAPGVPPDKVDLDNITVEQFTVPRKFARPLARRGVEYLEAQRCAAEYVPGQARNVHVNVRMEAMTSTPVLLPVWVMAYRYRGNVFRFLVNGQNGRATGQAPISYWKVAAVAALAIGAALLLAGAIAGGLLR